VSADGVVVGSRCWMAENPTAITDIPNAGDLARTSVPDRSLRPTPAHLVKKGFRQ
jgi:hypothetical protein